MPFHVAIILDGNRRWAKEHALPTQAGHKKGADNVKNILNWSTELDINQLTLYCFSTENFNRSEKEKEKLFSLFRTEFDALSTDSTIKKNGIKIRVIGDTSLFPQDMQDSFARITEQTKNHDKYTLNFCLGYGSRAEITSAVSTISKKVAKGELDQVTEQTVTDHLYLSAEPDIFIRPGGEKRMSNFLLWQVSYSELFFLDKLWPDIKKEDIQNVINEFQNRKRRFGE